ncbi:MAG TPA: Gfo/Idh/MocA family oxidoreductase [Chromatiaceae bacterium]|nr:Gfo/Idh/MocA family oxidoreductase [Chromatiaceae bacterium]
MALSIPVRIGIIGLGHVVERFVKATRFFSELVITAVADVLPPAEARDRLIKLSLSPDIYFQVEGDSNLPAEFWNRIDAVYDASPQCFRKAYFHAALDHGKHLLLEKPPGRSAEEGEEILRRSAEHRELRFMCTNHYLFYEPFRIFLKWVRDGELRPLGRIRRIEGRILEDDDLSHPRYKWLLDPTKSGGGVGVDTGVHLVSRCYALGAEAKVNQAERDSCLALDDPKARINGQSRIPETYLGILANLEGDIFTSDSTAWLQVGKRIPKPFADKSFTVLFEHGKARLDHTHLDVWLNGRLWKKANATSEPYANILATFLNSTGADLNRTLEIAVRSLELIFEAYNRAERVPFYREVETAVGHLVPPEMRVAERIRVRV